MKQKHDSELVDQLLIVVQEFELNDPQNPQLDPKIYGQRYSTCGLSSHFFFASSVLPLQLLAPFHATLEGPLSLRNRFSGELKGLHLKTGVRRPHSLGRIPPIVLWIPNILFRLIM